MKYFELLFSELAIRYHFNILMKLAYLNLLLIHFIIPSFMIINQRQFTISIVVANDLHVQSNTLKRRDV